MVLSEGGQRSRGFEKGALYEPPNIPAARGGKGINWGRFTVRRWVNQIRDESPVRSLCLWNLSQAKPVGAAFFMLFLHGTKSGAR